jgi:AAA family ATP:ADP antiporter
VARSFVALLLLISAHTMLETARDAMLLARFPARALGVVYVVSAASVFPFAFVVSPLAVRFGPRRVLSGGLVAVSLSLGVLFALPEGPVTLIAIYVVAGLVGSSLVPLFWNAVGGVFTVTEGRRLLGIIGAAGVLGGVMGSASAAALLRVLPVKTLLPASAVLFLAAMAVSTFCSRHDDPPLEDGAAERAPGGAAVFKEPFVRWIVMYVAVSTAALILVDFTFKWNVARSVPRLEIAPHIARYYVIVNLTALLAQIASGALVRRMGIAANAIVTPVALLAGAVWSLLRGGGLAPTFVLKGIDGTLRNSVHRATSELVYLPLPPPLRVRVKPLIDGALSKAVQLVVGGLLLAAGLKLRLTGEWLTAVTASVLLVWAVTAALMRSPYLTLLRGVIAKNGAAPGEPSVTLDMETAEALVAYLSHEDPRLVIAAMNALVRRGRGRLVSPLILLHEDEAVLVHALRLFGESDRQEWVRRARTLLADERESVRMAAARALALHGALDAHDLATSPDPRTRGYATLHLALATDSENVTTNPLVAEIVESVRPAMADARLGLLAAIGDAPATPALARLLMDLTARAAKTGTWTEEVARAAAAQRAPSMIPRLVERLAMREGREAVRAALVALGPSALDALAAAMRDSAPSRAIRAQVPGSIARFGTRDAANLLLTVIETNVDGLVRYKAIRALGWLVDFTRMRLDRRRVERHALASLEEHFRLLALRSQLDPAPWYPSSADETPPERLLVGLLEDKLRQSLERTFRLLKIAHPREDIHRVHDAYLSGDRRALAAAAEFLEALLRRSNHSLLRELLVLKAGEPKITELAVRASVVLGTSVIGDRRTALALLAQDDDATVAALAKLCADAPAGASEDGVPGSHEERRTVPLEGADRPVAPGSPRA